MREYKEGIGNWQSKRAAHALQLAKLAAEWCELYGGGYLSLCAFRKESGEVHYSANNSTADDGAEYFAIFAGVRE